MNPLARILGVNWRTTILGVGVIFAAVGRIGIAYRTRDFEVMANDGQLIAETTAQILGGLGLLIAKDANVTGAGTLAKTVESDGTVKNAEGEVIARQPQAPPMSTERPL
jgi:hypothetical protein